MLGEPALLQRDPGAVRDRLGARAAAAVEPHARERVAAVAARAVLTAREADAVGAHEPVVVQVRRRRGRPPRAPPPARASRTTGWRLWACTTRAPRAADGVRRRPRARRPPLQQPARRGAAAERRRVALEHLRVLAEVLPDQPREVGDRALLAAREPVAVVQEEDHGAREPKLSRVPPTASVLFPTRRRREYLAVALASVAPQARAPRGRARGRRGRSGGRRDARGWSSGHGGRYLAHGAPARHQRRPQHGARGGDGRPAVLPRRRRRGVAGLARRAAAGGRASARTHEAFGGPIRPRLEGGRPARLRARAAAGDLARPRARGRATPSSRGARTSPCGGRRWSASAASTPRSAARATRRTGSGACAPPAGASATSPPAGVDHRRAGADARIARLVAGGLPPRPRRPAAGTRARAPRRRPRRRAAHARRLPVAHRRAAAAATGSCWPRQTAGRLRRGARARAAARPPRRRARLPLRPLGHARRAARALTGAARDAAAGALALPRRLALRARPRARAAAARARARRRARRSTPRTVAAERRELARSRHDGRGPPRAAARPARASGRTSTRRSPPTRRTGFDWLLLLDDDVRAAARLPRRLPAVRRALRLRARPAGARVRLARRLGRSRGAAPGVLARRTRFVEIGPGDRRSHRDAFDALLPFPDLRDGLGPGRALGRGRRASTAGAIGVVDATPIRHLRPVAGGYAARRGDGRGRGVPRRPRLRDAASRRGETLAAHRSAVMRVAIVAEYYPRAADPVLGVWAHRQALAARDAGADVRVLVLHRPVPAEGRAASPRPGGAARAAAPAAARATLDGIEVTLRPVPRAAAARAATARWGAWAAPPLALALRRPAAHVPLRPRARPLRRARRATPSAARGPARPLVVSVHGGDVLVGRPRARRPARGRCAARSARARLVLANSAGDRARAAARSARATTRVVHLGTDLPASRRRPTGRPRSSPSPTWSRASATPTSCARCGCCATRTPS